MSAQALCRPFAELTGVSKPMSSGHCWFELHPVVTALCADSVPQQPLLNTFHHGRESVTSHNRGALHLHANVT